MNSVWFCHAGSDVTPTANKGSPIKVGRLGFPNLEMVGSSHPGGFTVLKGAGTPGTRSK